MRRRLVVAMVGAVAAAVAVVGLGTLALTRLDARHRNEEDLARRLEELAIVVGDLRPGRAGPVSQRMEGALDVDSVEVVRLDDVPPPFAADDVARLRSGEPVSTRDGDTAFAAAPLPRAGGGPPVRALLASDSIDRAVGPAGRWFVVAGTLTVLLGAGVALAVARSLAGPVVAAEAAAQRIAAGDLAARVPEPGGDDELARLSRSVNALAASLERADRSERDFLLSVSHDLRTPLTSIGGWAEALADGAAPDPARAGATILVEAGRLDRLVRDLLDLARLRARAFTLNLAPVDLRDVAAGTAEGLRPELEDAGVRLVVDVPPQPVVVQGDADRLAQIAGNLIENAGRHAAGEVRVSVHLDGEAAADGPGAAAVLAVADDGPGVPPEDRARIFERLHSSSRPFARPGPGAATGTGLGLGLAIVRELARAMGGDATAVEPSRPNAAPGGDADDPVPPAGPAGQGAHLVVRLPLLGAEPAAGVGLGPAPCDATT
jgi:signal transduction histidine kinase